ncbi:BON domain-containing protein [Arsukibacterium sp.]|uniref:BON domain-containing protein n=1 Tax=Arsukibacterium sp. TaxID=1977258 RepID=UPI0035631943
MQAGKYTLGMLASLLVIGALLTGCERQSIEAPTDEAGLTIAPEKGIFDDLNITTAVSTSIRAEQRLENLNIQVETDKGDVRLHGDVATEEQRQLAEAIARGTPGVHAVNNDLEIK